MVWDEIDVTVELREDSSFHVTERDRIDFIGGPFRSGYREIPLARIDAIDNVRAGEVDRRHGPALPVCATGRLLGRRAQYLHLSRGGTDAAGSSGASRALRRNPRTFQIDYDAFGALRVYNDAEPPYQQISWIGVGEEITKSAPVNNATLRFVLPRPVDPGRTFIQGPGSQRPEDHTTDGKTWTWTASNLGQGDSLEAGLQFEPLVLADGALVAGGERSSGAAAGRAHGDGWPAQPPLPRAGAAASPSVAGWQRWPRGGHGVAIPRSDRWPNSSRIRRTICHPA